jgi:folate-dependent phosphoribosylglycinamide formyltransferase PurN
MVVIGLYDYFSDAVGLLHKLDKKSGVDLYILVCNNFNSSQVRFYLRHLRRFLGLSFRDKIIITRFLVKRRLVMSIKNLDNDSVLSWVKNKKPDIALHCTGAIYRENLISLFKIGILNSHIGILPKYRGRSVMEWSIINGDPTGITAFFVDEGIDTGRDIIFTEKIDLKGLNSVKSAKEFLFNYRIKIFVKAIDLLLKGNYKFRRNEVEKGFRYYIMSDLFRGAVEEIFKSG